ncbi:MAG: arginase family protein [Solirubrobacterales bacterium]|nr:arginase family protein [Solirubrobacterales bacterium]
MISLVALQCRTSDRTSGGGRGARALADELGMRLGIEARLIGSPGEPREASFADDLRDSRGCLLEAGGQVDDALAAGDFPMLLAGDCSICMTTLPGVMRHHPEARILWLDAHGDFNTPETTPSGFLGGMCLAAACGRWETGLLPEETSAAFDPARVTLCGVRDLDPGERVGLELAGVHAVARPSEVADLVRGGTVYVHLDLDVLDPGIFPAQFPVAHGLSRAGLRTLLAEVARASTVVGTEITAFEAPEDPAECSRLAELVGDAVEPLLAQGTGPS